MAIVNIHLTQDEKFIDNSINSFEKYYPGQNLFIVDKEKSKRRFVTSTDTAIFLPFNHPNWLHFVLKKCSIDQSERVNVLVHFLTRNSANRALELKKWRKDVCLYWIFYGADLYSYLENIGKYELYDYKVKGQKNKLKNLVNILLGRYNYVACFCKELNFFCFWNYYDYELLCKNVKTEAKFKLFYYVNTGKNYICDTPAENDLQILINHSASFTGNHLTVIEKLASLSIGDMKLLLPLSYGPDTHKKLIIAKANAMFPGKCSFLTDYMPIDTYYEVISKCQCAIMGHRRQEAGGNISFLLRNGKKVFLREDNTLLKYYRDLGCFIYSFETDLKSKDDLCPLTEEQQAINKQIMMERISPKKIDEMMLDLFKTE